MSFLGKVKKKLRNGSWYPFYNTFYEKNNLDPHMILLESRSGKALESNILSLLKELCQEPYRSFTLVLSVHRDSENEIKEKLQKNSIQGVHFVRTGSVAYYHALSRAGYLVNDTSFPGRFIKKEGRQAVFCPADRPALLSGDLPADERYRYVGNPREERFRGTDCPAYRLRTFFLP